MIRPEFCLPKDSFGYNNFISFIDHVNNFQHLHHILSKTQIVNFTYSKDGIPIYDVFEFFDDNIIEFKENNIIFVETLRQLLSIQNRLDNTKKYIVFSESNWDIKKQKLNINYELIYVPWDFIDCQFRLTNRSSLYFHLYNLNFIDNYSPVFDFLCLAGRAKPWRDKFIDKLSSKIDLSRSLTSYYGKCLGNQKLIEIDISYDRDNSKIEFENKFYKQQIIPCTNIKYTLSNFTKNELFYSTKFSVIVETEAELEEYHVTEKTIKCLLLGHPFVVIGTPFYLKYLHDLGFTTYNRIFDESYDNILDLEDRMDAVINLIEKLKQLSFVKEDLEKIQQNNLIAFLKLQNQDSYKKFLGLFDV